MKIVIFRYDTGIVTRLYISDDVCCLPWMGAPAADRWQKCKKILSAVPRRGHEAGVLHISAIFMILVWTRLVHVCFSRVHSWVFRKESENIRRVSILHFTMMTVR